MRTGYTHILTSLIALVLVTLGGVCHGVTISDGGSLKVSFGPSGAVSGVAVREVDIIAPGTFSGFDVQDMNSRLRVHMVGRVSTTPDGCRFEGENRAMAVALVADVSARKGRIDLRAKVTDLSGEERALRVFLTLNLKEAAWRWCHSLTQTYQAEPGKTNMSLSGYAWHDQSTYPFGAVSAPDGAGLALAWPMDNPRFFTQTFTLHKNGGGALEVFVPIGLSKYTTRFPHSASFDISIYAFDGRDGFRGALVRYYSLYPKCFESRAKGYGLWTLWLNPGMESYAQKMGVLYHEAEFDLGWEDKAARDDKLGLQSLQYCEPWGLWHPFPKGFLQAHPGAQPSGYPRQSSVDQAALEEYIRGDQGDMRPSDRFPGATRDTISKAMFNSAVYADPQGNWMLYNYTPGAWIWENRAADGSLIDSRSGWDSANVITNPDPDLPHPNRFDIEWDGQVMYAARKAAKLGAKIDGVYVDSENFSMAWDRFNFRTEQWKYAQYPLVYAQRSDGRYVPAQALALCFSQHLSYMRSKAARYDWPLLVNGWDPLYAATAAQIDILGAGEVGAAGVEAFAPESIFATFRALAYRKPVIIMDYAISLSGLDADPQYAQTVVEPHLNYLLMYGILPGTANSFNAASEGKLRIVAPVFEKYRDVFKAINNSGWEPVGAATCDDAEILLEQWGKNTRTGLYYTLRNTSQTTKHAVIKLDLSKIEGPLNTTTDLIDSQTVAVATDGNAATFSVTVPAGRTLALRLR